MYKDDPSLAAITLAHTPALNAPTGASPLVAGLYATYNQIGGLVDRLGQLAGVDPRAALAVWSVESGRLPFIAGKPVLRFENHQFYHFWGKDHEAVFDAHFRFGGHGAPGKSYENHAYRVDPNAPWIEEHKGGQDGEYAVFNYAVTLSTREDASLSSSWGGTQIMGFNHETVGYVSASAMVEAFGRDLRWQVIAFFDFCTQNGLLPDLKQEKWEGFGSGYNGQGQAATYGTLISKAYSAAQGL